jgi:hypothetical protein
MNILDYLTNAMTGGQPTQQELMARQMAQQGLLGQQTGASLTPEELKMLQMQQLRNVTGAAVSPRELPPAVQMPEYTTPAGQMQPVPMPQLGRQPGALPPSRMPVVPSSQMSPYMQNLTNPGMTMQQNYMDPRLIEQMYYRGLLSQ